MLGRGRWFRWPGRRYAAPGDGRKRVRGAGCYGDRLYGRSPTRVQIAITPQPERMPSSSIGVSEGPE